MSNPCIRSNIKVGMCVRIESKYDMGTGKLTEGIVKKILTPGTSHPYGIMVDLEDGMRGRVKQFLKSSKEFQEWSASKHVSSIDEIKIPTVEDPLNEFKETFRFDVKEEEFRKNGNIEVAEGRRKKFEETDEIRKEVAITVSAFANNEGGELFLGIRKDGTVIGLERDMKKYNYSDNDIFGLKMTESLENFLKDTVLVSSKVKLQFIKKENKNICHIKVLPANYPVFIHDKKNGEEFYVRSSSSAKSQKMDKSDCLKYCITRFRNYLKQD